MSHILLKNCHRCRSQSVVKTEPGSQVPPTVTPKQPIDLEVPVTIDYHDDLINCASGEERADEVRCGDDEEDVIVIDDEDDSDDETLACTFGFNNAEYASDNGEQDEWAEEPKLAVIALLLADGHVHAQMPQPTSEGALPVNVHEHNDADFLKCESCFHHSVTATYSLLRRAEGAPAGVRRECAQAAS